MAKSIKVPHKLVPSEEREMFVLTPLSSAATADVEEDKPDKQFWVDVCVY